MTWARRAAMVWLAAAAVCCARGAEPPLARVPLIDTTDLYHPHQDVGDNMDLVSAYALPEVDLKAVILDTTEKFRREGRDAGFIPVVQLNAIFNRSVPCAVTPYRAMTTPDDTLLDAPAFQQAGIELLLETLRRATTKTEITVFGSARAVAAAYNRQPALLRERVRRVHLCAGASSPTFLEWNVVLDPQAMVCLLRSDLPVAIYPCATQDGPFAYGPHNGFWRLPNLQFVAQMDVRLQAYLAYAFSRSNRVDFLRCMEETPPAATMTAIAARSHNVWETCVWLQVCQRRLVRRADGHYRILPAHEVQPTDRVLPNELRPCQIHVAGNGGFRFEETDRPTHFWIYDRGDARENERALREALPALYRSYRPAPPR